jgi:hypothetical protein
LPPQQPLLPRPEGEHSLLQVAQKTGDWDFAMIGTNIILHLQEGTVIIGADPFHTHPFSDLHISRLLNFCAALLVLQH